MKKIFISILSVFLLANCYAFAQVEIEGRVALIVDPNVLPGIRDGLNQFEADLQNEGYIVVERISDFLDPAEARTYLQILYETEQNLVGAILIGNIPYAYQWVVLNFSNPSIPSTYEETISFQYYSDLDGIFDSSPDYTSPGGHEYSYDIHNGEVDWEIWIGVLPMYKGDYSTTIEALNRYFEKNHAYRNGEYNIPRSFMQIDEHFSASTIDEHYFYVQFFSTGDYSWTPFSNAPNADFYFDSPPANLSVDQGYSALSAGEADFTVGDAHGYWGAHGQISISWVENNPVNTVFFWSNGCAVGNIDYAENFITSLLYSPTSAVLVAKGTTNNSGGMGNNENGFFGHNIATSLSHGDSLGQAILNHVNVPLISPWSLSREFHFATNIIVGDPTLRIGPPIDIDGDGILDNNDNCPETYNPGQEDSNKDGTGDACSYNYYFPYFISGSEYWYGVGLRNSSNSQVAGVSVAVFDQGGDVMTIETDNIPARGQNAWVVGEGLEGEGWVKVSSDQPLTGLCFIGEEESILYMADITLIPNLSPLLNVPHVAQYSEWDTAILVCNPNNSSTTVILTYVDKDGNAVYTDTHEIAGNGSGRYELVDLVEGTDYANGSVEIDASQGVAAFALYDNLKWGGYCFSGISAVDTVLMPAGMTSYGYYFPYFISGSEYWYGVGLRNFHYSQDADVSVIVYDQAGNVITTENNTIPARGQDAWIVGSGIEGEGWVKVSSDQPLTGLCFIGEAENITYMADITLINTLSQTLDVPHVAQDNQWDTAVLVCNPNGSSTTVTLTFVDTQGNALYTADHVIPANGSGRYELSDLVEGVNYSKGSVEIDANQGVAAFALYDDLKWGSYCYAGISAIDPSEWVTPLSDSIKMLYPLYSYPNWWNPEDYIWDDIANKGNEVSITAIINPNNGPGSVGDPNSDYVKGMTDLAAGGLDQIGYVSTDRGNRDIDDVKNDIKKYNDDYALYGISGIFLDEVSTSSNPAILSYYEELHDYIKSDPETLLLDQVVFNHGTYAPEAYTAYADVNVVFEGNYSEWLSYTTDAYLSDYNSFQFAYLVYDTPTVAQMQNAIDKGLTNNIGWGFVTDDLLANPWDQLPSYWIDEIDYIAYKNQPP